MVPQAIFLTFVLQEKEKDLFQY